MTDPALPGNTNALPAPAGQPTQQQSAQAEAATQPPQYVTREEAARIAQSAADKAANSIRNQVQERLKQIEQAYKLTGQDFTPEVKAAARQNVLNSILAEEPTPDASQPPAQASAPAQEQGTDDPVMSAAYQILQAQGVTLDNSDPEIKSLKLDGTAGEYLASVAAAAIAKKARTNAPPPPVNPQGILPSGGMLSGSTTPSNYDPTEDPINILDRAFKSRR